MTWETGGGGLPRRARLTGQHGIQRVVPRSATVLPALRRSSACVTRRARVSARLASPIHSVYSLSAAAATFTEAQSVAMLHRRPRPPRRLAPPRRRAGALLAVGRSERRVADDQASGAAWWVRRWHEAAGAAFGRTSEQRGRPTPGRQVSNRPTTARIGRCFSPGEGGGDDTASGECLPRAGTEAVTKVEGVVPGVGRLETEETFLCGPCP